MSEPVDPPSEEADRAAPLPPTAVWRWRRVFRGHRQELAVLRRWLSSLLPECPSRDDVLSVASELASNAVLHTASGHGGWFAVEITVYSRAVLVAVADCGSSSEPRMIDDPGADHGRGLLMVHRLSVRTGVVGDGRGRLVWAQVPWDPATPATGTSYDPYQDVVREGEAALARRFAGVPAWFGRSTLAWWAMAGPQGLVSAPSARELAGLLSRLLGDSSSSSSPAPERSRDVAGQQASRQARRPGTGSRHADAGWRRSPGTGTAGRVGSRGLSAGDRGGHLGHLLLPDAGAVLVS